MSAFGLKCSEITELDALLEPLNWHSSSFEDAVWLYDKANPINQQYPEASYDWDQQHVTDDYVRHDEPLANAVIILGGARPAEQLAQLKGFGMLESARYSWTPEVVAVLEQWYTNVLKRRVAKELI